jgi:hypothetical protein
MAKLNETLKAKLVFNTSENMDPDFPEHKQIIVSTQYKGIYRQYSFHIGNNAHNPLDVDNLVEEAKNILTQVVESAMKKHVQCRACGNYIIEDFKISTIHKCENCGEMNDIKVLIEKK